MDKTEIEIFRLLDDKLYSVYHNNTYKFFFREMDKNIELKTVQAFIDKIIYWYIVKYNDNNVKLYLENKYDEIDYTLEQMMSIDNFLVRINSLIDYNKDNALLYYNQIITMAGWGLLYSDKTIPEYGYFRVKKMFEEFNAKFNLNLDITIYDSVININYSYNNPKIMRLIEQKKEEETKKKKITKSKKLFRW